MSPLIIGNLWIPFYILFNLMAMRRDEREEYGARLTIVCFIGCVAILLTPVTSSEMVNFIDFIPLGWIVAAAGSVSSTILESLIWRQESQG
jgi:hypothetical protein